MANQIKIELIVDDKGKVVVKSFGEETKKSFKKMEAQAKESTDGMGSSLSKLKEHWVAYSAGAVAAVLMVRKVITAVMANIKEWVNLSKVQEKAEITLAAALKASGEYTDALNKKYQEFASSIQKVTTYGDEQVLGLMALIKNLGVSTDKVEEATKMAIGLATATNRDVQSMAQYVALAMQGEFTMLRRYIPALRSTTDATEQLKIVTDFAARGFKVAEETTSSYGDSLAQLRNLWNDLKEKLGDFITRNKVVLELIQKAKHQVTKLNEQLVDWYENNQNIINQKTHEAVQNIATAVNALAWGLKSLYEQRNVLKEVFLAIPGTKELKLIKDIIAMRFAPKPEGQFGVIKMPIIKPEAPPSPKAAPPSPGPGVEDDYYKYQLEDWAKVTEDFYEMKKLREQADLDYHKTILSEWGQVTTEFYEAERAQWEERTEGYLALTDIRKQAGDDLLNSMIDQYQAEINLDQQKYQMKQAVAKNWLSFAIVMTGALTTLAGKESATLFYIAKAAGVAQATISAFQAYGNALASVPFPYNVFAAKAVLALGLANAAAIAATAIAGPSAAPSGGGGAVGIYPASPYTGAPTLPYEPGVEKEKGTLTIHIHGPVYGEEEFVRHLAEKISENVENYDIRFVASETLRY